MRRSNHSRRIATDDPVRLFRQLAHRSSRDRTGLFATEGIRALTRVAAHPESIHRLLVSWRLLTSVHGRKLVRALRRQGVGCTLVTPEEFRSLSRLPRASGVALILRQRWTRIGDVDPIRGSPWFVLRHVQSPGNLGTLVRTLAAVGGGGVILLGEDVDPFDAAVVRAAMGALFELQLVRTTTAALLEHKRRWGSTLIGTSPIAARSYREVDWSGAPLIFLGTERKGMADDDVALCDTSVAIPMVGATDSLNLGVAGSLLAYEVFHARRGGRPP